MWESRNAYDNIINRSIFIIINRIIRYYRYIRDKWRRIIMNASFRGSGLFNPLKKVKDTYMEGEIIELTKEECKLRHRDSILKDKKYLIFEATFELKKGDQIKI